MFCELFFDSQMCASGSGVEYNLAKVGVAGSNPVSRFSIPKYARKAASGRFSVSREIRRFYMDFPAYGLSSLLCSIDGEAVNCMEGYS